MQRPRKLLAVEAGAPQGWHRYVGSRRAVIREDEFYRREVCRNTSAF
jgi:hypothetical protein